MKTIPKPTLLAISGSLRTNSSNNAVIRAAAALAADNADVIIYESMGTLPHFDDSSTPAQPVIDLRNALRNADGILISSPEYAFGVPGVLKNLLDWTVSSGEFVGKPVALITAATGGSNAHASLLLTLGAISAVIPEGGAIVLPFIRSKLNENGDVADMETKEKIKSVMDMLVAAIAAAK